MLDGNLLLMQNRHIKGYALEDENQIARGGL